MSTIHKPQKFTILWMDPAMLTIYGEVSLDFFGEIALE